MNLFGEEKQGNRNFDKPPPPLFLGHTQGPRSTSPEDTPVHSPDTPSHLAPVSCTTKKDHRESSFFTPSLPLTVYLFLLFSSSKRLGDAFRILFLSSFRLLYPAQ